MPAVPMIWIIRPLLHFVGFSKIFSKPSVAELSLTILGLLVLLF